jgi:hypothetical protein
MIQEIVKRGRHEIDVHGWIHESLPDINDAAEEERLLKQAIDFWTRTTGKRPVGYRSPARAFSKYTLDLIWKAGFEYDSSAMGMDEPYELLSNDKPTGMVELPVDWILDDYPYFNRDGTLPSPELVFKMYQDEFDQAYKDGTMFMLTMHPMIAGHRSRIMYLDKFIAVHEIEAGRVVCDRPPDCHVRKAARADAVVPCAPAAAFPRVRRNNFNLRIGRWVTTSAAAQWVSRDFSDLPDLWGIRSLLPLDFRHDGIKRRLQWTRGERHGRSSTALLLRSRSSS